MFSDIISGGLYISEMPCKTQVTNKLAETKHEKRKYRHDEPPICNGSPEMSRRWTDGRAKEGHEAVHFFLVEIAALF